MKPLIEKKVLIKFGETDPQGFVYFARVFEIAHEALEEYWRHQPQGWAYWFKNSEFAVPIRHAASEYLKPLRAGETYDLTLCVQEMGDSSVDFVTEFSHEGETYALVQTVHVFIHTQTLKKLPIPSDVRQLFQAGL